MKFFKSLNTLLFMLWIVTESSGQELQFLSLGTDTLRIKDQEIIIKFRIKPGYHIQSNEPGSDLMIPSRLDLEFSDGSKPRQIYFSEPHEFLLEGVAHEVFSDSLTVRIPVETEYSGMEQVKLEFFYQACDERKCYFPRKLSSSLWLK